jgi:FAD/FMN-containing dehydrogenase
LTRELPAVVWQPESEQALREVVAFLVSNQRSIVTRGAGHSSGGQSLNGGGDVISMRGLADIGEVEEDGTIWVQAGCLWQELCHKLRRQMRRPLVLTDNWEVSVGGSLAVGGVGATSHRYGLQVDAVDAVVVLTLDGVIHEASRGDTLFDYVLAGRGQLGVLIAARVRTVASDWSLYSRALRWSDWKAFEQDARKLSTDPAFDLLVTRVRWGGSRRYRGAVGTFDAQAAPALAALGGLNARLGPIETVDYYFEGTAEFADRARAVPAVEFSLPWPDSRALLMGIFERVEGLGLADCQPGGTRICWWPGRSTAALGPFAPSGEQLFVSLRPEVKPQDLPVWLSALDAIAARVVRSGGRIYSMSYGMREMSRADAWLGPVAEIWHAHKRVFDSDGLLNPSRSP